MVIKMNDIKKSIVSMEFILVFFSSACLWSETNLNNYLLISILVVIITFLLNLFVGFSINKIVNNRYIIWILIVYSIFELYGILFLRIGQFNWDFVLFSGVLQICLTLVLLLLNNEEDIINCFCKSCKWALLLVCLYMLLKGDLKISAISFGSRLGADLSGNVNTVATNIGIMLVPTTYLLFLPHNKKISLIINWGIVLLGTLCMILTGSKKGLLVLVIIFVMYFVIIKKPIKYLMFPLLLLIFVYAIFNVQFLYDTIGFRVVDMLATLEIGTSVTAAQSTAIRDSMIKEGLRSFWNHPFFGGGMNYFQFINNTRYYSHNNYVELLNNMGIVGLILYYGPFINVFIKLIHSIKKRLLNEETRKLYVFLVAYLSVKFILDWAMVSYTALCTFTIPFLFVFEIVRREKKRSKLI